MLGQNVTIDLEQFKSQMTFLKTHIENQKARESEINSLQERQKELEPAVQEYDEAGKEIDRLKKESGAEKKFLMSMNEMVLHGTGRPVSEGPLFEQEEGNGSQH